jgi:hypothetical protein
MTDPLAGGFFSLNEVAAVLGADQSRVERWAEMGALPVMGSPEGPRVRRDDLEIVAGPWLGPLALADRLGGGSGPLAGLYDQTDVLRARIRSQMFAERSRRPRFFTTPSRPLRSTSSLLRDGCGSVHPPGSTIHLSRSLFR